MSLIKVSVHTVSSLQSIVSTPHILPCYFEGQFSERDSNGNGTKKFNSITTQNSERYFNQIVEPGFITNVLVSNSNNTSTTDNEDNGYEILSSKDEAAERGSFFTLNKECDRQSEGITPVGGAKKKPHVHKKGRKIAQRPDLRAPDKESPESSVWSENTDDDVIDLGDGEDGSVHHKHRYMRKGHYPRAITHRPNHKPMTFISNPTEQNFDKTSFKASEAKVFINASQETLNTTATLAGKLYNPDTG